MTGRSSLDAAMGVVVSAIEALEALRGRLDAGFDGAVALLHEARGRVIVTGMGKSGLVAAKVAATFCSTGTPAFFLQPAEALHGDLGLVTKDDVVLAFSKSGRTAELSQLLPLFDRLGVKIVAVVGDLDSPLARSAAVTIPIGNVREAGPGGLVPTASTTVSMTLGDALAVALMERRGFDPESLAFVHAGGLVGRQAALRVSDLMHSGDEIPVVPATATLREGLVEIIRKKLGMTVIDDGTGRPAGVLTDGDLKRILVAAEGDRALEKPIASFMTKNPRTVAPDVSIAGAVRVMEDPARGAITSLVVLDSEGRTAGILHLHDCLKPA